MTLSLFKKLGKDVNMYPHSVNGNQCCNYFKFRKLEWFLVASLDNSIMMKRQLLLMIRW